MLNVKLKKGIIKTKKTNPNKLNKNIPISISNFLCFIKTENSAQDNDASKVTIIPVLRLMESNVPFEIRKYTPINPIKINRYDLIDVLSLKKIPDNKTIKRVYK